MGSLVVSLDAELAWGTHDLHPLSEDRERRVAAAREAWTALIEMFGEHRVPATWAVVGHLLLKDGEQFRRRHPLGEEWFEQARRGLADRPERWLGVDLVESLRESPVDHEIGSHSFSHVVFNQATTAVAEAECRLAREASGQHGINARSFVFPRNAIAHRKALSEAGFVCYRGRRPWRFPQFPGLRGGAMVAGAATGAVGPPIVAPRLTDFGLVNVPASMFLGGFRGKIGSTMSSIGADPATRLAIRGIDQACERSGVFHLWLHPNDLTDHRYYERIDRVLSHAAKRREEGKLRIETMVSVADEVLNGLTDE